MTHGMTILRFNSRAHGGRDQQCRQPRSNGDVSIHAPTGGATPASQDAQKACRVSIHAPTGGATPRSKDETGQRRFQFTRPRGARRHSPGLGTVTHLVSIHAPTGGATGGGSRRPPETKVSIHAPTGGATADFPAVAVALRVSIHAPTGGATHAALAKSRASSFQFTRPRGARHWAAAEGKAVAKCFNSRAHGGRDSAPSASARSRTFQFTRPRGARLPVCRTPFRRERFQFTRPRGARHETLFYEFVILLEVSIHAPTGGATSSAIAAETTRAKFQFTRPRGARLNFAMASVPADTFQFTRPRGARPSRRRATQARRGFNSRAHGGRDALGIRADLRRRVSIHAPTGGATRRDAPLRWIFCFNSRAHGGRDSSAPRTTTTKESFNSRAHGGRDGVYPLPANLQPVSIHAPTGGATSRRGRVPPRVDAVSIHAPTGGATAPASDETETETFQFTRPRGARPPARDSSMTHAAFQFTRPRGARQNLRGRRPRPGGFNSRAHGGRDDAGLADALQDAVSIHAPTGGATAA